MFSPLVMSWNTSAGKAYRAGFRKPKGALPASRRAELARVTMAANTGAAADVPEPTKKDPPTAMG